MRPFKAQAVTFQIDYESDSAQMGALIVTEESDLIAAGTVGEIPLTICNAIMEAMEKNGWDRVLVNENGQRGVIAMCRGTTDWAALWHVAPWAYAQSQAAAIDYVMHLHDVLGRIAAGDDGKQDGS